MDIVLVVYASFGEGHKKAALALAESLSVNVCDVLDFTHPLIKKIYTAGYLFITGRTPVLWRVLFSVTKNKRLAGFLHAFQRRLFVRFFDHLKAHQPRIIIATHFSIPILLEPLKNNAGSTVVSVVTDIRAHPLWASSAVDRYFVASELTADDLCAAGIERAKIGVGYVAVRDGFLRTHSLPALREKYKLLPRPTLLFVSSRRGTSPFLKEIAGALAADFNILVIYGSNISLYRYLRQLNEPSIRLFSFYEAMWELMEVSSVIITKPGGLTVFEGVYKKKLFVFTHFIPGQEKENMDFLIQRGVARYAANAVECIAAIRESLGRAAAAGQNYPLEFLDVREPLRELIQRCR